MLDLIMMKKYKPCKDEFLGWKRNKKLFQKLPFSNVLLEKPKIKGLKNTDLLHELPFYD